MRPGIVIVALVAALATASCGSDGVAGDDVAPADVTVFAAASLTAAFTEIGDAFMAANPGADVTFNFAGSSELVAQIGEGAPADVFASADLTNMTKLTDAGPTTASRWCSPPTCWRSSSKPATLVGITGVADLADDDLIVVHVHPRSRAGRTPSRSSRTPASR